VFYWHPAASPSGFAFDTGSVFNAWNGSALLGGLSSEALLRLTFEAGNRIIVEERIPIQRRIRDLIEARDGSLLMLTDAKDGELLRLTPAERLSLQQK
jgi:glucose/arabinose dehydrogenase